MPANRKFRPQLHIDLGALQSNYRLLVSRSQAEVAAVVKADAYGLGLEPVAKALWDVGCRNFFTAFDFEALALRDVLSEANIYVMVPGPSDQLDALIAAHCIPCLYAKDDVDALMVMSDQSDVPLRVALHLDTGINRLGLSAEILKNLLPALERSQLEVDTLMTHLACADDPASAMNREQLGLFAKWRNVFPKAKFSMANSAGLMLDEAFVDDLARPGLALYGCDPHAHVGEHRFRTVASLLAPIAQIRHLSPGESVGYGAAARASQPMKIAVVAGGYADGINRLLWRADRKRSYQVCIAGQLCPLFGRVSMDLISIDVTHLDDAQLSIGTTVEIFGSHCDIEDYANYCETISYEVLTSIGRRVKRCYIV